MWPAIFIIVAFYVLMIALEPQPGAVIALGSYALGIFLAWYTPVQFKKAHVTRQNALMDRCRALLMIGSRSVDAGGQGTAEQVLARIRRLEWLWRFGSSLTFRVCLAIWAVMAGIAACVAIRIIGLLIVDHGVRGAPVTAEQVARDIQFAIVISAAAPFYALFGYFDAWANPHSIDNCGDRLWKLLYGPRAVTIAAAGDIPNFDGMTPREVFGLGYYFSRRELDRARRQLVLILHPDRWHGSAHQERRAREEALKRVNAAYDALRAEAMA